MVTGWELQTHNAKAAVRRKPGLARYWRLACVTV